MIIFIKKVKFSLLTAKPFDLTDLILNHKILDNYIYLYKPEQI
jgi:hypothetical protein